MKKAFDTFSGVHPQRNPAVFLTARGSYPGVAGGVFLFGVRDAAPLSKRPAASETAS